MICPNCGTSIPDDAVRCPACHADMGRIASVAPPQGTWCPSCGSLVPDGEDVCPHCGMPVARPKHARASDVSRLKIVSGEGEGTDADEAPADDTDAPQPDEDVADERFESEDTAFVPRIVSALPAEPVSGNDGLQRAGALRVRTLVVALAAALLFVGGGVLFLTHPWDPNASDSRAKSEADTSMAGFPGIVTELKGQDGGSTDAGEVESGDATTYRKLSDVYGRLKDLEERADADEQSYRTLAATADSDERTNARNEAYQLSLDVSNLISSLSDIDVTSGTYADDLDNMKTLANWLRNRTDVLNSAWKKAMQMANPSSHAQEIDGYLRDGDSYKRQFDEHYDGWKPQEK